MGARESHRPVHGLLAIVAAVSMAAAAVFVLTGAREGNAAQVQTTADTIVPELSTARGDRGRPDRCPSRSQLGAKLRCIYGVRGAERTAVVFGDSKVMQYFPVLRDVARARGMRLIGLMRAGCPPMNVKYAFRCDEWRKRNLRRLRRIDPDLVITGSGAAYQVVARGKRLNKKKSRPILRRAYMRLLRKLVGRGSEVAVMVNPPRAPSDPVACVSANLDQLDRCAFERGSSPYRNYVTRAARRVPGVEPIDVNQVACPARICPAVIDDVLVLRDRVHFTATYVRTLRDWLNEQLPTVE